MKLNEVLMYAKYIAIIIALILLFKIAYPNEGVYQIISIYDANLETGLEVLSLYKCDIINYRRALDGDLAVNEIIIKCPKIIEDLT